MQLSRYGVAAAAWMFALPAWAASNETPTTPESAASTSSAPAAERPAPATKSDEDEGVAFGVLGGLGFPRPLMIEGLLRVDQTASFGIEYSVLPKSTLSGVETRFWAVALDARVFPLRGPFYLGLRAGSQHLAASMSASVTGLGTVTEGMDISTLFVNPRIGFLWGTAPGFAAGFEVGVQIPVSTSVSSTLPPQLASVSGAADNGLVTVANAFGKNVLPTVDLLRFGVLL